MNLEELTEQLKQKLGEKGAALAAEYGPAILAMGATGVQTWLNYVFVGRYIDAHVLLLKSKDPTGIAAEWDTNHAAWTTANAENARQIEIANAIGLGMVEALMGVMLAALKIFLGF